MKTIAVRANEVSQPFYAGAGSRITLTGSGYVEWAGVEKLQDALNGATWQTWPAGSTAGYRDTDRGMAIRVAGTGDCTVTVEEGKADRANENAYWQGVGDNATVITNTLTGRIEKIGGAIPVLDPTPLGIVSAQLLNWQLCDRVPGTNLYIGTEQINGGDYARAIVEYDCTSGVDTPTRRVIASIKTATPAGGGAALGSNTSIHGIKCLADGRALVHVFESTGNKHYIYCTNSARTSIGSDASHSNGQASINLGESGGTHYAGVRTLSVRSIAETVSTDGTRYYWVAEYNVRTSGERATAMDEVRIWRSSDAVTWAVHYSWNVTGGAHYTDHLHGIVQNPHTGWIYFLSGDDKSAGYDERWILGWDGISAWPVAGKQPHEFAAMPGFEILRGTELVRVCDLICARDHVYALPDMDYENSDTTSAGNTAMRYDPAMRYMRAAASFQRIDKLPPLLGLRASNGVSWWLSFHSVSPAENAYFLWSSGDDGETWTLVAKLNGYETNSKSGVPWNFYELNDGRLLIAGGYAKGVKWQSSTLSGESYVLTPGKYTGNLASFG